MAHSLFSVFGVEIEIMCVERGDLKVWPHVDLLLTDLGGSPDSHPAVGLVEADNELAAHVVELKLSRPSPTLSGVWRDFLALSQRCEAVLKPRNAGLLPGGVHPFMNPATESRLWPYEDSPIYSAYDRIFGCQGHGWFNLQSVHLNLPFAGDAEFAALHSAIALILPLLPALSNSSPVIDGLLSGWHSSRLQQYSGNQRKVASIAGNLIPEAVGSEQEYRDRILAPMYRDMATFDPEGILRDEWLNSRAAIARFDRHAIEIRCLDAQETPRADVALCWAAANLVRFAIGTGRDLQAAHRNAPVTSLRAFFEATARQGRQTPIPADYPWQVLGAGPEDFSGGHPRTAGDLLSALVKRCCAPEAKALAGEGEYRPVIEAMLRQGSLAERLISAAKNQGGDLGGSGAAVGLRGEAWAGLYRDLGDCLLEDRLFGIGKVG